VRLHSGAHVHLVRETMANIEGRLSGHRFARVHRGWIVNLDRVRHLVQRSTSDPELVMQDGRKVRVGRAYRHAVERRLAEPRRT